MRITVANIEAAKEQAESITEALESFQEAADTWLECQEPGTNADERRDARGELEAALEELDGLVKLD